MLQAAVYSNQIVGLEDYFQSNPKVAYHFLIVDGKTRHDLRPYDLLIVPNGTDQIAVGRLKRDIHAFLDAGKTVFCFDGWFTDWVPGNQWVMDNSRKTINIRYTVRSDRHGLFDGISVEDFTFLHGMSGWWACGYINPAPAADVVLEDTWGRAIIVLDEHTTPGTLLLTASGPLGDSSYGLTDNAGTFASLARFYHRLLDRLVIPTPVS